MKQFLVEYEYRKTGAIGWPSRDRVTVQAETEELAKEEARRGAYALDREHVHIARCDEVRP